MHMPYMHCLPLMGQAQSFLSAKKIACVQNCVQSFNKLFGEVFCYNRIDTSKLFNLLWPHGAIWWHKSGSTLVQVMAWCHQAPSHYLNQCWLVIIRSCIIHLRVISQELPQSSITKLRSKITYIKIPFKSPRGQWGNIWLPSYTVVITPSYLKQIRATPALQLLHCLGYILYHLTQKHMLKQNGYKFADNSFERIFLNKNACILV